VRSRRVLAAFSDRLRRQTRRESELARSDRAALRRALQE
jgi:hypothetical protein